MKGKPDWVWFLFVPHPSSQKLSPADRLQHLLHPGEKPIARPGAMGEPAPTPQALENLLSAPAMAADAEATALRAGHPTANAQQKQKLPANTRLRLGILLAGAPTRFSDITMAGWLFFLSNTAILTVCAFLMLPWTDPQLPAPLEVARGFLILGEVVYFVLGWGICKALDIRFLRRGPVMSCNSSPNKLPQSIRPGKFFGGKGGTKYTCFKLGAGAWGAGIVAPGLDLCIDPKDPHHGIMQPEPSMLLADLETTMEATRPNWQVV